jgi:hypothetical protein
MEGKMNFETFIKSSWHNYWIKEGTLNIYVRKTPPIFRNKWGDFQLASLSNDKPGNGDLKRFLDKYELIYQFYIENILNPRLERFFLKRSYRVMNDIVCLKPYPPCMLSPSPDMLADLIKIVRQFHSGEEHD